MHCGKACYTVWYLQISAISLLPNQLVPRCEVLDEQVEAVELLKSLLTKTTMTAAYAAQALNISDLFALFKIATHKVLREETELCLVTCDEVKVENGAMEHLIPTP